MPPVTVVTCRIYPIPVSLRDDDKDTVTTTLPTLLLQCLRSVRYVTVATIALRLHTSTR